LFVMNQYFKIKKNLFGVDQVCLCYVKIYRP
jgi:hypothetical protein